MAKYRARGSQTEGTKIWIDDANKEIHRKNTSNMQGPLTNATRKTEGTQNTKNPEPLRDFERKKKKLS